MTSRPASAGFSGAGSVHHVAWASNLDEHVAWREKATAAPVPSRPR